MSIKQFFFSFKLAEKTIEISKVSPGCPDSVPSDVPCFYQFLKNVHLVLPIICYNKYVPTEFTYQLHGNKMSLQVFTYQLLIKNAPHPTQLCWYKKHDPKRANCIKILYYMVMFLLIWFFTIQHLFTRHKNF